MPKKNQKPTPEYDSQRETRVLLEQIRSEVKAVAEQHGDVIKKFDVMEQRFDRVEQALLENSTNITTLKQGQKRIEQKLDTTINNHEKRIHNLENKISV
jgi:chromosome segregation ATPase